MHEDQVGIGASGCGGKEKKKTFEFATVLAETRFRRISTPYD